jgi:hypothetical protein
MHPPLWSHSLGAETGSLSPAALVLTLSIIPCRVNGRTCSALDVVRVLSICMAQLLPPKTVIRQTRMTIRHINLRLTCNYRAYCKESAGKFVPVLYTNGNGEFTLPIPSIKGSNCYVGDNRIYTQTEIELPVNLPLNAPQLALMLNFQMIPQLHGTITGPGSWKIKNALVEVIQNGVTLN